MIVDTSVIVAILLAEPETPDLLSALADADRRAMSAGSWIELTAVLVRRYPEITKADLELWVARLRLELVPVTLEQASIGEAAYRKYGRNTRHPAKLNFGDCFAYALAKATSEPLLFKGDDFTRTDVEVASLPPFPSRADD